MASKWNTLIYARPGQGKSICTARIIRKLFREYRRTERRYPALPQRILLSNLKLNTSLEAQELITDPYTGQLYQNIFNKKGQELTRHLEYWENPKQLRYCARQRCWKGNEKHSSHDIDIVIDELPNYCPSDGWKELPRWFRKLFAQHRHRGIRIYANTQDYKAVDINYRRMVTDAYRVDKIFSSRDISATLPPVRFIFGLIVQRQFNPDELEERGGRDESVKEVQGMPKFFFLTRRLVETYDTQQDIPAYEPEGYEHRELQCLDGCGFKHVTHRPT